MADNAVLYSGSIVTRQEAKGVGLKRYFTGKACPHGHIAQRLTSNTACVECNRVGMEKWRALWKRVLTEDEKAQRRQHWSENKVLINKKRKQDRARDPERYRASQRKWYRANRELVKKREKERIAKIGTKVIYARHKANRDARLVNMAGRPKPLVCDLCNGSDNRGIVFDHCHASGKFRGWLCDRCNKVLGLLKDDPSLLRKMATYLEKSVGREVDSGSAHQERCFAPGASCAGRPENPCQENGKSQTLREPAYPQDGWSREDTEELPR